MISVAALAATVAAPLPKCPGNNTIEINECLAGKLAADDARMTHYLVVARKRLREDRPKTLALLDESQRLWARSKDADCLAVYDYWSDGTIRTAAQIGCLRLATNERTRYIWRNYLTYMDSTPPVLPEPPGLSVDD